MEKPRATPRPAASKKLNELTLLYQFSNTLLSTIRLNKLTHLILAVLTSGPAPFYERAMLFLLNEKSGVLQGMLGVTAETVEGLDIVVGTENPLSSRLDISDEVIAHQRASEFCGQVRATRIEVDENCSVMRQVIFQNQLCHVEQIDSNDCPACGSLRKLGASVFAAVPLLSREKNLGIIIVDNPRSGARISPDELSFLQLFASQAGMAIENSMLYNRIEDANYSLRDAREQLIHGERLAAIGEMAANLAHELKNPLVTIGGFAGRLLKALPVEGREYHYADTIVREVGRLERMLADILAFSSKPTICYTHCQLGSILEDCFDSCAVTLEDSAVILTVSGLNQPWPVLADAHQLKQVFLNLLLNACEAMPDGGSIKVVLQKVSLDKNSVMVSISDTGGGIPPGMLAKIFTPFVTTKHHGTGLGLAIVNRILLNHNGTIEASNDEKGAVFKITLPLVE